MESLIDRNRQFLQSRFPGVWESYQAAPPLPPASSVPDLFVIPLPNGPKLSLRVDSNAYAEQHRNDIAMAGGSAGALVWGVTSPEDLEVIRSVQPDGPFLYVESDPVVFSAVLRNVDLAKLFAKESSRVAFLNDCGQLLSEIALAFGDEEALVTRIFVSVAPGLFSRVLTDAHPLGQFVGFILRNVFLNQSEEEKNRGTKLIAALDGKESLVTELFPSGYLYQSFLRFLKLYLTASPGIRSLYRDMPGAGDPKSVLPISIVILAWNRWDLTERCLRSVFSFPLPAQTEIVVVDNASTDLTPVALKKLSEKIPQLRTLRTSHNLGPAGGRDAAMEMARGRTLVFLDNDVEIKHTRWLEILLEPLVFHPRVGACGAFGVIHTNDETETWSQKVLFPGLATPVSWISSFCVAVRKKALADCGGWRPDLYPLYGMEDVALGWALRESGWVAAVPGQFVPVNHGMNHRDGHYDYDTGASGAKNTEAFRRLWGRRTRILNLARGNATLAPLSSERSCESLA